MALQIKESRNEEKRLFDNKKKAEVRGEDQMR